MANKWVEETFPVVDALPLRLSVTPDAIREHFEDSKTVQRMTDEQLEQVGAYVLQSDRLYELFHRVLVAGFESLFKVNPEHDEPPLGGEG